MKYEGKVYAKINGRYIECTQTVADLENEIKELKWLAHKGLPGECIAGWDEVKFCPHRLGDGNQCQRCSDLKT